jgi:general secretion pathway protein G
MKSNWRRRKRGRPRARPSGRAGYTLLEIMVVVFILGLLATLVAPKILGRTEDARRAKATADATGLEQALNLYRLDTGAYPTTAQGLEALVHKPDRPPLPRNWNPNGYIERVPLDPWGNAYVYVSDGSRFTLKSLGADGAEGGEGKFADVDGRDQ